MATGPMSFEKKQADGDSRPLLRPAGFLMQDLSAETTAGAHSHSPVKTLLDNPTSIDGGGYKASMDDPKKLPLWLVPVSLMRGCAAVMAYGAKKYAANNWRRGMAYSEVYSALQRHLTAWADGEDNDGETNLSHLWHAACCLAFLMEYVAFAHLYSKFDDRFKRPSA